MYFVFIYICVGVFVLSWDLVPAGKHSEWDISSPIFFRSCPLFSTQQRQKVPTFDLLAKLFSRTVTQKSDKFCIC
jgi:hypothetical protein